MNVKMASQKDMFRDCEFPSRKSLKKRISSTVEPSRKKHEYLYEFIILFNWDVDLISPFSHHELKKFNDSEIKPEWLSKNLGVKSRISKLRNLSHNPGQVFSLFAKIELGAEKNQIADLVKDLNRKYQKYSENCTNVTECLQKIAEVTPYR